MSARCVRCGVVARTERSFLKGPRSYFRRSGLYCPPCWGQLLATARKDEMRQLLVFSLGTAALCAVFPTPFHMGWLLGNWFLAIAINSLDVLPHELGHALAGRLVGWRVFAVRV